MTRHVQPRAQAVAKRLPFALEVRSSDNCTLLDVQPVADTTCWGRVVSSQLFSDLDLTLVNECGKIVKYRSGRDAYEDGIHTELDLPSGLVELERDEPEEEGFYFSA